MNRRRLGPERVLAMALATVGGTTALARAREIHPVEHRVFRTVNDLPHGMLPPVFVLMQAGSYPAVFVVAEGLRRWRRPEAAILTAVGGTAAWLGCKAVKRWVGRGRPSAHLDAVTTRGPAETGLGFPSGHSAVAFTLATIVAPELPRPLRPVVVAWAATVAWSRIYVGAHLPLDVVGGAAIGLSIGTAARMARPVS
jgi:undecaprenyl-diphosphatase